MRVIVVVTALLASLAGADARATPSSPSSNAAANCPNVGSRSHGGCDDGVRARDRAFDMWELARSWTPGYCASSRRACAARECAASVMEPTLTLHGLWPSFSTPVDLGSPDGCYWPQNCEKPSWYPSDAPWAFDRRSVPPGRTAERLAPAWAFDGLGAHEWAKHGTCAAWVDARGTSPGMTQAEFINATFNLAEALGTPRALTDAAGTDFAFEDAQAAFGGAARVALGCTRACELVQVVQCFAREKDGGVGAPMDCPCVGVRDSRYDNSCARDCPRVKILAPDQTPCHRATDTAIAR